MYIAVGRQCRAAATPTIKYSIEKHMTENLFSSDTHAHTHTQTYTNTCESSTLNE